MQVRSLIAALTALIALTVAAVPALAADVQWMLTGPAQVPQGTAVPWQASVVVTEDSQGLAGYAFTLAVGPSPGPNAGADGIWGTPDDEGLAPVVLSPAVWANSFRVGGGTLASVKDPAAAGGPGLTVLASPGLPNLVAGELQQVGASHLFWDPGDNVAGVGLDSRKAALLADSDGAYVLHSGEIPTTELAAGEYTAVLVPLAARVLRPDLDFAQAQPGFIALDAAATGGSFEFTVLVPQIPGDFDTDGDVDIADFEAFVACETGPDLLYDPGDLPEPAPGCTQVPDFENRIAADLDRDGDVDQRDFGIFQRCYSGSMPGDPGCAE